MPNQLFLAAGICCDAQTAESTRAKQEGGWDVFVVVVVRIAGECDVIVRCRVDICLLQQ